MLKKININCDGGSRGNPGPSGIGLIIRNEDRKEILLHKEKTGIMTNNEAEYHSLIKSLEFASQYSKNEVNVFMDSELVIRQVTGKYKLKAKHLIPLHQKVKELEKNFKKISYSHVSRYNKLQARADKLVNESLNSP